MAPRALALAVLVAGCATIDRHDPPPADFPVLRIVHHYGRIPADCSWDSIGCAVTDFCARRCDVYLAVRWAWVREHEELHCKGYDHPLPDWQPIRSAWENYKANEGPAWCRFRMGEANYCRLWPEHCGGT